MGWPYDGSGMIMSTAAAKAVRVHHVHAMPFAKWVESSRQTNERTPTRKKSILQHVDRIYVCETTAAAAVAQPINCVPHKLQPPTAFKHNLLDFALHCLTNCTDCVIRLFGAANALVNAIIFWAPSRTTSHRLLAVHASIRASQPDEEGKDKSHSPVFIITIIYPIPEHFALSPKSFVDIFFLLSPLPSHWMKTKRLLYKSAREWAKIKTFGLSQTTR